MGWLGQEVGVMGSRVGVVGVNREGVYGSRGEGLRMGMVGIKEGDGVKGEGMVECRVVEV